jgi:hypothetical protein
VRGIAVLSQRVLVLPYLEGFFGLSPGLNAAWTAPLTPSPSPRWGEGNRGRLIFSQLQRETPSERS